MTGRRHALLLGLSTVLSIVGGRVASGQDLSLARPEDVGMSTTALDRLRSVVARRVDEGRLAGVVALLVRDGRVVFFESFGMRDRRRRVRMRTDDIFRIASMTKPVTSVAVMILVENGLVELEAPIAKYLPALDALVVGLDSMTTTGKPVLVTRPLRRSPTVHDLLLHTAGFSYGDLGTSVDSLYQLARLRESASLSDLVEKLSNIPLNHQPGAAWTYGYSTEVLGHLVEVVSGQTLDRFFAERIFEPLRMGDTGFWVASDKRERVAKLYHWDGEQLRSLETGAVDTRPLVLSGGGGLFSTAADYARFSQMLLNGGELDGVRVLREKTVALMVRNHLEPGTNEPLPGYGFGYGFAVRVDPGRAILPGSIGAYDWGGGTGTGFWIDPQQGLIGVYLTQIRPLVSYRDEFRGTVYQALRDIR